MTGSLGAAPPEVLTSLGLPADDQKLLKIVDWLNRNSSLKLSQIVIAGASVGGDAHKPVKEAESRIIDQKLTNSDLYDRLIALIRVIDAGNAQGRWQLCLPRQPYRNKPQLSPFHPQQSLVSVWMRQLDRRLSEPWPQLMSDKQWLGALIIVISLRGGLHSLASIRALLNTIEDPLYSAHGSEPWRDLSLKFRQQEDAERRRWYPDPLSEILLTAKDWPAISNWETFKDEGKWPTIHMWFAVGSALTLFLDGARRPVRNVSAWLKAVGYYWQLQLPPVIQSVAGGVQISHATTPACWSRLLGVTAPVEPVIEITKSKHESDEVMPEDVAGPIENLWMSDLTRACRVETSAEVRSNLRALKHRWPENGSAQHLIPQWAEYLIEEGGATGQALEPASVVKYLSLAGRRIANSTGEENLLEFGIEGLAQLYEEILQQAQSVGHRKYLAKTLRAWHRFLAVRHGIGEIDEAEVLGLGSHRTPVDAVVLTLDEFLAVRRALIEDTYLLTHGEHAIDVAWMLVTLGFRCGLRRREALGLRVRDVHWSARPEVLIRPFSGRRLKSASASRRIPLHALLDEEELARFQRIIERRSVTGDPDALLMDIDREGQALGQSVLIPRLHALMRHVTGGATIRFHHLRHSFGTWNLLRLMMSGRPLALGDFLPGHPQTVQWLTESGPDFRQALLGTSAETPTRKSAYAVARLLGHASVSVTMEHYFHAADWLIADASRRLITPLTFKAARELAPLPKSSMYRNAKDRSVAGVLRYLRRRNEQIGRLVVLKPPSRGRGRPRLKARDESDESVSHHAQLYKAWWAFLVRTSNLKDPAEFETLCRAHDMGQKEGRALIEAAKWLGSVKHHRGHRHPTMEIDDQRALVPSWPNREHDEFMFREAADKLGALIDAKDGRIAGTSVLDVLSFWASRAWRSRTWLYLTPTTMEQGKQYVAMIQELIGDEYVEVITHKRLTDRLKRQINAELGLPQRRQIHYRAPTDQTSDADPDAVLIRVVHPDVPEAENRTARSWRLLMFMANIHSRVVANESPAELR